MTRHPTIAYSRRSAAVQLVKWADAMREHRKTASAKQLGEDYAAELQLVEDLLRQRAAALRLLNKSEGYPPSRDTA